MTGPADTPVKPVLSWRGGPELDTYTEWEYRSEQADHD